MTRTIATELLIREHELGRRYCFNPASGEVRIGCNGCHATFPQSDGGFTALSDHEFEAHESASSYDPTELNGKVVTILTIEREPKPNVLHPSGRQVEMWARDEDGVYYSLPFSHYNPDRGGHKWKPRSRGSALLRLMPGVLALPSNGSRSTDARPDPAIATTKGARVGRWLTFAKTKGRRG